jgi:hypothetical protein
MAMSHVLTALLVLLFHCGVVSIGAYAPYSLLDKSNSLIGLYPFDEDATNSMNKGNIANSEDKVYGGVLDHRFNSESVSNASLYFDGTSYAKLAIGSNPSQLPKMTIGGWLLSNTFPDGKDNDETLTYIFKGMSENGTTATSSSICHRGLMYKKSSSELFQCLEGSATSTSLLLPTNVWTMVAITYDSVTHEAMLYVGGQTLITTANLEVSRELSNWLLLGGSATSTSSSGISASGFQGSMDNVFVYADVLSTEELDFLRTAQITSTPVSAVTAGGAVHFSSGFGISVPSSSIRGGSFDSMMSLTMTMWLKSDVNEKNSNTEQVIVEKGDLTQGLEYKLSILDDHNRQRRMLRVYMGQLTNTIAINKTLSSIELAGNGVTNNADTTSTTTPSSSSWLFVWESELFSFDTASEYNWNHIGVSWDGQQVRTYINGSMAGSTPFSVTYDNITTPTIVYGDNNSYTNNRGLNTNKDVYTQAILHNYGSP